jgi:hypothetical protein
MKKEEWAVYTAYLWACFMLGVLLSTGCSVVSASFLAGEEAAYSAISGEYVAYVSSDTSLSGDQVDDRKRTVRAWRFSLDKAAEVSR